MEKSNVVQLDEHRERRRGLTRALVNIPNDDLQGLSSRERALAETLFDDWLDGKGVLGNEAVLTGLVEIHAGYDTNDTLIIEPSFYHEVPLTVTGSQVVDTDDGPEWRLIISKSNPERPNVDYMGLVALRHIMHIAVRTPPDGRSTENLPLPVRVSDLKQQDIS